jgi:hypothetical protein
MKGDDEVEDKKEKSLEKYLVPFGVFFIAITYVVVNILMEGLNWRSLFMTIPIFGIYIVAIVIGSFIFMRISLEREINKTRELITRHKDMMEGTKEDFISTIDSQSEKIFEKLEEVVSQIMLYKELNELYHSGYLMNTEQLIQFEGKITKASKKYREIRVLTKFLEIEKKKEMKDGIVDNITRGITYRYLIPENKKSEFREIAEEWREMCLKKNPDLEEIITERIKCVIVPNHFPYMTVVVYGPDLPTPDVVVKFPYREPDQKEYDYERWMFRVIAEGDALRISDCINNIIDIAKQGNKICESCLWNLWEVEK